MAKCSMTVTSPRSIFPIQLQSQHPNHRVCVMGTRVLIITTFLIYLLLNVGIYSFVHQLKNTFIQSHRQIIVCVPLYNMIAIYVPRVCEERLFQIITDDITMYFFLNFSIAFLCSFRPVLTQILSSNMHNQMKKIHGIKSQHFVFIYFFFLRFQLTKLLLLLK